MDSLVTRFDRRRALRVAVGGLLAVPAGLRLAGEAGAATAWCRSDPVLSVDGQLADIFVASSLAMQLAATGPLKLVVTLPPGAAGRVLLSDVGFGAHGYAISYATDAGLTRTATHTQVCVAVYAPANNKTLPVTVTFAPRALSAGLQAILSGTSASGYANAWIPLKTP